MDFTERDEHYVPPRKYGIVDRVTRDQFEGKNTASERREQKYYTCYGEYSGRCGQTHATLDAATNCIKQQNRAASMAGGKSDRHVFLAKVEMITTTKWEVVTETIDKS